MTASAAGSIPPGLWDVSPAVAPTQSYVTIDGNPGDYISGGRDYLYTKATARLTVSEAEGRISVRVEGPERWSGEFYPSDLARGMQTGDYYDVPRGRPESDTTGVSWTGEGRGCNGSAGWIAVDELTRVAGQITSMTLRFSSDCEGGPGLHGKIRWSAADTTGPPPAEPIPAGLWDAGASVAPGQSYVLIDEPFGRHVPGSQDLLYTKADAKLEVILTPDDGGFLIRVKGDLDWTGVFDPVDTAGPLQAGRYYGPTEGSSNSPVAPGLDWSGAGLACGESTGWFTVDELTRTADRITRLTLRFSQTCRGGQPMYGKVHWESTDHTTPPGPRLIPYDLWDADPGVQGDYVYVEGAPGDFISQGHDFLITPDTSDITVTSGGASMRVGAEGASGSWSGTFLPMSTIPQLQVGFYPDLMRWPFGNAVKGMLDWGGQSRGCNWLDGWMAVDEVVRVGDTVTRLVLRFEQSCEGAAPLHGKIVWGTDDVPLPGGNPFGSLDLVTVAPGGVLASGWALDPDSASGVPVIFSVDQQTFASWAVLPRADVAAAYPAYGGDHGFSMVLPASPGPHRVCVTVYNRGIGYDDSVGCRAVVVPPPSPFGSLDVVRSVSGGVQVGGWAVDPDSDESIPVHVYVDGRGTAIVADGARSDIGELLPAYGPAHGYASTIAAAPGRHEVCVYGINTSAGGNTLLGCQTVDVPSSLPIGSLDVARQGPSSVVVGGWALDPDTTEPIPVHVYVDGKGTAMNASGARPDVGAAYPGYGSAHGFSATIAATPGRHQICVYGINAGPGTNALIGCRTVDVPSGSPIGTVDVARGGPGWVSVGGWALDADTGDPIQVHVYVDSKGTAITAGGSRPDVGAYFFGWGDGHGYATTVSATPGTHNVCVYGINVGPGGNTLLGCRTVTVT